MLYIFVKAENILQINKKGNTLPNSHQDSSQKIPTISLIYEIPFLHQRRYLFSIKTQKDWDFYLVKVKTIPCFWRDVHCERHQGTKRTLYHQKGWVFYPFSSVNLPSSPYLNQSSFLFISAFKTKHDYEPFSSGFCTLRNRMILKNKKERWHYVYNSLGFEGVVESEKREVKFQSSDEMETNQKGLRNERANSKGECLRRSCVLGS